jgi:3-oxoacyl-[acyl-carrier protein] reductase
MKRLDGQVAIVTGAARGIGAGIAGVLREEGASIVVADIDGEAAKAAAAAIDPSGEHALAITTDVTVRGDLDALADAALQRWGRIDILAANAGIYPHIPLDELDPNEFDRWGGELARRTIRTPGAGLAQGMGGSC